jgi:GNAT superfamily N-acetyltransferase
MRMKPVASRKPPNKSPAAPVECVSLGECPPAEGARLLAQAEQIFFETSQRKTFDSEAVKHAFLQRWFGNYADAHPGAFLFALDANRDVTGYLAGCPSSFSPASKAITGDIFYFTPSFCAALKNYPSHFHINVMPGLQGQGIGHVLVARFAQICASGGATGIHVVTSLASRSVKFYEACGFRQVTPYAGADPGLAVLVRTLA